MRWLVSYDIGDDNRRQRLAKALLDYGERVQESVYWLEADDELAERIRTRVAGIVDGELDSVWVVPLCLACAGKTEVTGPNKRPEIPEYYIL